MSHEKDLLKITYQIGVDMLGQAIFVEHFI